MFGVYSLIVKRNESLFRFGKKELQENKAPCNFRKQKTIKIR